MAWARRSAQLVAVLIGAVAVDATVAMVRLWRRPPDQVLDRRSGEIFEEARPLLDRVQIALVWNTFTGSQILCRTPRFLAMLGSITERLGTEMELPASPQDIQSFIDANGVDTTDLDRPLASYSTINEFFTRTIAADKRPVAGGDDVGVVVSPADARLQCRHLAARPSGRVVVKGRSTSVAAMFGLDRAAGRVGNQLTDRLRQFHDACEPDGFAVAVNRLAPGDYHRFHWPVDASWDGTWLDLDGALHSVAPTAVDSRVDVFGTNRRKVLLCESTVLGPVALVIVGAIKVASITLTSAAGDVQRGDELGIFAYGGSTVVTIFDARRVRFDEDLWAAARTGRETRVRVGEQIGQAQLA